MFDKKMFDEFYKFEPNDPNFTVDDKVKEAYTIFIGDFCPCVSKHWKNYLSILRLRQSATFVNKLTPSDEIYTYWWLTLNYDDEKSNVEYIIEHGEEDFKIKNKEEKTRGKHQVLQYQEYYVEVYLKIEDHRDDAKAWDYWQAIYFDTYLSNPHKEDQLKNRQSGFPQGIKLRIPVPKSLGTRKQDDDHTDG